MKVTLIDHTDNPVEKIGRMAAICYDSNTGKEACIKRASSCVTKGHLATLRFAYATFHVEDISRACSHQLVRHKHLDYLQRSQRYIEEKTPEFVVPPSLMDNSKLLSAYRHSIVMYEYLISEGVKKEDARMVLPNGITTELVITGNFQAWLDFIRLRTDKAAQWEILEVALEIKKQLATLAPEIFNHESLS